VEIAGVLVGDSHDAVDELAVDARAQLDRRAVRADEDGVAPGDSERLGVG
jgi:hypothetical protein